MGVCWTPEGAIYVLCILGGIAVMAGLIAVEIWRTYAGYRRSGSSNSSDHTGGNMHNHNRREEMNKQRADQVAKLAKEIYMMGYRDGQDVLADAIKGDMADMRDKLLALKRQMEDDRK